MVLRSDLNSTRCSAKTPTNAPETRTARNTGSSSKRSDTTSSSRTGRSTTRSVGSTSQLILAVAEGRGQARGDVGIACIGVSNPNLILCQVTDSQNYAKTITKVNIFNPSKILMASTSCELAGQASQLYRQLQKTFKNIQIVPLRRRIFSDALGLRLIKSFVNDQFSSAIVTISQKYYALAATSALLKYMEVAHSVIFSPRTLRVEFQGPENAMLIDGETAQHLELLQSNHAPNSMNSLIGILNNCRTPMGFNLLRMTILQPPCHTDFINQRLDCVEELTRDANLLYALRDVLTSFSTDLDQVISGLVLIPKVDSDKFMEQRLNFVIALKHVLELLPKFVQILSGAKNPYFQHLSKECQLPVFAKMMESISEVINSEAHVKQGASNMKLQRTFAVSAKVNPIMDISRKVYCELINDINQYVLDLCKDHEIPFRLCESVKRGYHLQFTLRGNDIVPTPELPDTFLQVHRSRNVISFTTDFLLTFDHRTSEILKEIHNISVIVVAKLVVLIREDVGNLYQISEAVSNLDILHSFAVYALSTRSVRPQFSNTITAIQESLHPILSHAQFKSPVPNSTFLSSDANFMLLTGPNMSGKTTYLKQVATLQILAQIGSFIPAKSATFRIADCIFSRMGNGDSIDENISTFKAEMAEMKYILTNISENSLVIIDELGRATSIEEGTAMSWSMAEAFLSKNAFVLCATHYLFLTKLESVYLNALNYKMDTLETPFTSGFDRQLGRTASQTTCRLDYTHTLRKGVTDVEIYGLKLARNSPYPSRVVSRATDIAYRIIDARKEHQRNEGHGNNSLEKQIYLLGSHLFTLSEYLSRTAASSLSNHMIELQNEMRLLCS